MRPRNLKLQGFTCFRQPVEVDFSGLDVFVISGPTGAGKTTIIDAICYALYGRVPRETKISDLISRDTSAMSVQLEFEAGGRSYRVHRGVNVTRTTNKKTGAEKVARGNSPVQLEELVDGEWTPLGDRVDEIERAIERVVGLDYDCFTKCVLLPQGRFAEFLAGEPKQRRAVLIELLDIGIYERVMRAANARAATLNTQLIERERQLREDYADATEQALAATREAIVAAKPALETAKQRRSALQTAHTHATTAAAAYRSEVERREELKKKEIAIARADQDAAGAEQRLEKLVRALAAAEDALKYSPFDAAALTALRIAREIAERVERQRPDVQRLSAAAAKIDVVAAENAASTATATRRDAHATAQRAEGALREAERADAADALRTTLKPGDLCPVCGEKVRTVAKPGKSVVAAAQKAFDAAETAETTAAEAASKAENELARIRQAAAGAADAVGKAFADLAREAAALKKALPKGVDASLAAVKAAFEQQDLARKKYETLARAVEAARKEHHDHERSMASSKEEMASLRAEAKQLSTLIEQHLETRKAAAAQVKQVAATCQWPEVNEIIEKSKSPAPLLMQMLEQAQAEADGLTSELATLEAGEKRIIAAIARAVELRAGTAAMKESHQLCRELGVLLRADNFQEYVIVEAMQVLAEAATAQLATLYDRFAVTVDGGEFAVVDHWQADQVRPAKTLSGGETFVASLALALALSERLPELRSAAAASLESLFLDEGFGTLDPEALSAVIDALEGLRSEERMVGIITHVPELAQRIEHRIEVVKSHDGSAVRVAGA